MNRRSEKEIERIDRVFAEVIGPSTVIETIGVKEAKMHCAPEELRAAFPTSELCQKTIYPSAATASRIGRKRQKKGAGRLRVYRCDVCQGFHLTSRA